MPLSSTLCALLKNSKSSSPKTTHLSKIRPNGHNTKSKKLMEALGLRLAVKGSSSEEVVQAARGPTWQHKCAPGEGGQLGVRRCHGLPPCCYAPRAAKAIIALLFDRMFAFELNLPPLSRIRSNSVQHRARRNLAPFTVAGGWPYKGPFSPGMKEGGGVGKKRTSLSFSQIQTN